MRVGPPHSYPALAKAFLTSSNASLLDFLIPFMLMITILIEKDLNPLVAFQLRDPRLQVSDVLRQRDYHFREFDHLVRRLLLLRVLPGRVHDVPLLLLLYEVYQFRRPLPRCDLLPRLSHDYYTGTPEFILPSATLGRWK